MNKMGLRNNKSFIIVAVLVIIGGAIVGLFISNVIKSPTVTSPQMIQPVASTLLPGVKKFIVQNSKQYGAVIDTTPQPDWANGKRLQVNTTTGKYLFYLYENEVVGVRKYNSQGFATEQIFHKDIPQLPNNVEVQATSNIPAYKILFQVNLATGVGRFADILIPSYSKQTPVSVREATLRKIMKNESLVSATIYSTEEAYQANLSESYSKTHPNAKMGYLGTVQNQNFIP